MLPVFVFIIGYAISKIETVIVLAIRASFYDPLPVNSEFAFPNHNFPRANQL